MLHRCIFLDSKWRKFNFGLWHQSIRRFRMISSYGVKMMYIIFSAISLSAFLWNIFNFVKNNYFFWVIVKCLIGANVQNSWAVFFMSYLQRQRKSFCMNASPVTLSQVFPPENGTKCWRATRKCLSTPGGSNAEPREAASRLSPTPMTRRLWRQLSRPRGSALPWSEWLATQRTQLDLSRRKANRWVIRE